jgi:hypothetical protein
MTAFILALLTILARAQPQPTPSDAAPLAGHAVETAPAKATLVERDFMGELRHADPTAVEAAVKLLTLAPDESDRVNKVLADRALALDNFVEQHLDLIIRFGNAEHSTDGKEKFLLAVEAFQRLAPLRERGPLDQQLKDAMSPDNAKAFDRLLREYWNALAEDDKKLPKPKGRLGVVAEAKFKDLGKEIEAAFHRAEKGGGILYGYLFQGMTLKDEQRQRLHELCATYSQGGLDNKDKKEQGTFFLAVVQILDQDQRKEFVKRTQGKK